MISVNNVSLVYSSKKLFEDVNLKFSKGNCYGIIGANGAGKSTFLKILSGEIDATSGDVILEKGKRLSVLAQDHYKFDDQNILNTVISGYDELHAVIKSREELYAKEDFTEEDGYLSAELEEKFADLNGWEAEADILKVLAGLHTEETDLTKLMADVSASDKVKILLARALYGNPDVLLLDEPTNHLDFYAIKWLEKFLIDYDSTVIVVSHDRHFLNNVCTHIVDIDFLKAQLYVGNYDFWRESSELMQRMMNDNNKKKEERIKELENFISRFSANASKSKQATSRKKTLDKIELDDIKPSSRRYPYIQLDLSKVSTDGATQFANISFNINGEDRVAFISRDDAAVTALFEIISGKDEPTSGEFKMGGTVDMSYFPRENGEYFDGHSEDLVNWLQQYCIVDSTEGYVRGFLGKMLFSGDEVFKSVDRLSGGEKMRMMFSKLMLAQANTLIMDQPTNHLDLESIQSVNESLEKYEGCLLLSSHDMNIVSTVCNKIIEITPNGAYEFNGTFEEFLANENAQEKIKELYND